LSRTKKFMNGLTRRELLKYGAYAGLGIGINSSLGLLGCSKKAKDKLPNIILITLDTTRADHLSCYGYHRQTSPNLDKLAEESLLYNMAIAPSSWTLPSHASLFTGKFTSSHGMQFDPEGPFHLSDSISGSKSWSEYRARGIASNEITLAMLLKEAGYSTGAVVGGPWMKKVFGLNKGFEYYDDNEIGSRNGRLAEQVTDSAVKWIDKTQENKFFLFLNYFDPHGPYTPPMSFASTFFPAGTNPIGRELTTHELISLYDGEILYMDHYIGKLIHKLKVDNLYDNTLIIITADHGEMFGEHGISGHCNTLYQEEIHVPLFIKYPGTEVAPSRTDEPIQLNDIMAIILERLNMKMPQNIQAGVPPKIGHPVLAETYPLSVASSRGHWRAIFEGDLKFIWNSKGNHLLFNIRDDIYEQHNLATVKPDLVKSMTDDLNQYLAKLPKPGSPSVTQDLDENTKKALRSLGYVE